MSLQQSDKSFGDYCEGRQLQSLVKDEDAQLFVEDWGPILFAS